MADETMFVRSLVVQAVDAAAQLIASDPVAARWDRPSSLEAMSVGALSAHLVRAAGSTLAYLDRTDPLAVPDDELLTPVTYFHAALDSPIHDQIKDVSAQEATAGHHAVAAKCQSVCTELARRLPNEPEDRLVGALGGRMLTLDDFCRTRLIEMLLHIDDLASSVGMEPPPTDPAGFDIVIETIIGIARLVHGDRAVLVGLARAERSSGTIFPVL